MADVDLVIDLFYDLLLLNAAVREFLFLDDGGRFEFLFALVFVILVDLSEVILDLGLMQAFRVGRAVSRHLHEFPKAVLKAILRAF